MYISKGMSIDRICNPWTKSTRVVNFKGHTENKIVFVVRFAWMNKNMILFLPLAP